jgi:hypothetical protein
MLKTLVCLAVAMTGTSGLLGWIDPSPPLPADALSSDEVIKLARAVATDGLTLREGRWDKIEIASGPISGVSAPFLTATTQRTCHFLIDVQGRPTHTAKWTRQEAAAKDPRAISIRVVRRAEDQPMSRAQWQCIRALASAVSDSTSRNDRLLPILLEKRWAETYALAPRTALELPPIETPGD